MLMQFNTVHSPKCLKLNLGINGGNRIMMLFHRDRERNPPRLTNTTTWLSIKHSGGVREKTVSEESEDTDTEVSWSKELIPKFPKNWSIQCWQKLIKWTICWNQQHVHMNLLREKPDRRDSLRPGQGECEDECHLWGVLCELLLRNPLST